MATVAPTKPPEAAKTTKRLGRSSIRHSLNLASVGKALADVMNKEKEKEKDKEKEGKDSERKKDSTHKKSASISNAKDAAARRTSTLTSTKGVKTLDTLPEGQVKGSTSPDEKTVTTRKTSSSLQRAGRSSVDETGVKVTSTTAAQSTTVNKNSTYTLRPRKPPVASSNLPKYRPKSVIVEGSPKETLSAVRVGTRRKHSTSEEEKDNSSLETRSISDVPVEMEKGDRPISPLPRRATKPAGLRSASIDSGKRSPPREPRSSMERTPITSTSPRAKKSQKPTPSPVLKKSSLPRPSPRGGDTSSGSPQTPSSAKKLVSRYLPGLSGGRESPSPLRSSKSSNNSKRRDTITKASVKAPSESNQNTPTGPVLQNSAAKQDSGNESIDDIEMMLAAAASPSAPTPAIPRIGFDYQGPQLASTPPRQPTSILDLSLGVNTPQSERLSLPTSRRSTPNRRPTADRNSTVAWQALADLSLEINTDQLQGGLIKELDLPTTPLGLVSPSPSMMRMESDDGHERSPTPLTLPSPSKYGSISQMLLPTVTPFPPPLSNHARDLRKSPSFASDASAESATVTLLKLQLASMENLAKERLTQISMLEEQMHALKESRKRDERDLLTHVNELEQRLHETLSTQARTRSRSASISSARSESVSTSNNQEAHTTCHQTLQERMREVEDERDQVVSEALSSQAERERAERARLLKHVEQRQRLAFAMRDAHQKWTGVREIADGEMDAIHANRETLAVLRSALDVFEAQLVISRNIRIPLPVAARFHLT
ncbi:hypothetical protein ACEPAG_1098 [Sanghuangporus baumii]